MMEDHSYDDIINQPHHISRKRKQMSLYNRAAQFAPFAALTGYDGMVTETARLTDRRIELDEESIALLNQQLHTIIDSIEEQPEITLIVFEPDEKKEGGTYHTISGHVRRIDDVNREVIMTDRTVIRLDRIYAIHCENF